MRNIFLVNKIKKKKQIKKKSPKIKIKGTNSDNKSELIQKNK